MLLLDDCLHGSRVYVYPRVLREVEDGGETAYALPCMDACVGIKTDAVNKKDLDVCRAGPDFIWQVTRACMSCSGASTKSTC